MGITLRISNILLGFLYFAILVDQSSVASIFLIGLATAQIIATAIPFGSNNHLSKLSNKQFAWLFNFCQILIAVFILSGVISPKFSQAAILTCLLFIERLALSFHIKNENLDTYYLKQGIGRILATILLLLVNNNLYNEYSFLIFLEIISRILLFQFSTVSKRPNLAWKSTFFSALSSFATMWPISHAPANTPPVDIFIARVVIMLLGLSSVFYLTKVAIDYVKFNRPVIGFVRSKTQLIIIGIACMTGIIISNIDQSTFVSLKVGILGKFSYLHYSTIFLSLALWLISWNGAIATVRHNVASEIKLSVTCIIAAVICSSIDMKIYNQLLTVAIIWHLSVIFFYKETKCEH